MDKSNPRKKEFTSLKIYLVILIICNILFSSIFILKNTTSEEDNEAEWTFMVYMAGDNTLDADNLQMPLDDINEMEIAGSTDKVNIIVLCDRDSSDDKLYRIKKDPNGYTPEDNPDENLDWDTPISEELDDKDEIFNGENELVMADPQTLMNFVNWVIENYPAKKYLLDLWNHGQGWDWICQDFHPDGELEISKLKTALSEIKKKNNNKIDIIGFDACSMGLIEVFYQIKDYANFGVASEEEWPDDGWAYNDILPELIKNPEMSSKDLASKIVEHSVEAYRGQTDLPITHSAADLSKITDVINTISEFSQTLQKSYPFFGKNLTNIRSELKSFKDNAIDLYYFTKLVEQNGPIEIRISAKNLIKAIINAVVAEEHWTEDKNKAAENAYGMSIYFPKYEGNYNDDEYKEKNQNFLEDSKWDEFLENFYYSQTKTNAHFKKINKKIFDSNKDKIFDSIRIEYEVESSSENVNVTIDIYDSNEDIITSFYDEYSVNKEPSLRNKTFNNKNFGNDSYFACVYLRNENGLQDYEEYECFLEKCDITLSCKDNKHIVKPGDTTGYIIKIENKGNMDRNPYDTVYLEYLNLPEFWNASFDDDNNLETEFDNFTNVRTNSYKNVTLTIETNADAQNGIYNITIIGTSENGIENSSLVISTTISQRYRVNLTINGEKSIERKIKTGESVELNITILNEGNFNDTISLDLDGNKSKWVKFLVTPIFRLEPNSSANVTLKVKIPSNAKEGKYNLTILGDSHNGTSKDSVNVILVVEEKLILGLKPLNFFILLFIIFSLLTIFLFLKEKKRKKVIAQNQNVNLLEDKEIAKNLNKIENILEKETKNK